MDNKGFTIDGRVKLSTEEFDRQASKLENRLKEFQKLTKFSEEWSGAGQRSAGDTTSRFLESSLSSSKRGLLSKLEELNKAFESHKMRMLRAEEEIRAAQLKNKKEEIKDLQAKYERNKSLALKEHEEIREVKRQLGIGGPGQPPSGDGGGIASDPAKEEAFFKKHFRNLVASGVIAGVLNAASQTFRQNIVSESHAAHLKAEAMSPINREMRQAMRGGGTEQMFYLQERQTAAQRAAYEQGMAPYGDLAGIGAKIGGAAAAGGLMGGLPGALLFSGGALAHTLADERQRSLLFSPFSESSRRKYKMMTAADAAKSYEANLAAEKAANPYKTIAMEDYQANIEKYGQFQRAFGMSDYELFGGRGAERTSLRGGAMPIETGAYGEGWLQSQMKAGGSMKFTREEIMGAAQSLIQAGAGTQQALGMAADVTGFGRDLYQTNAASVLGRMSASGMGGSQTEAYKRMMAEAVRMGVDTSKMPQELMRFTEMTSAIATQGGGYSERAAMLAGQGLVGFSQSQIAAAGTAAEQYESRAKGAGGMEGQMGLGFLMSEKGKSLFGTMGAQASNLLNQISASDLQKDPALLAGLAGRLNISEEEVIRRVSEKDVFKQTRTKEQEEIFKSIGEKTKGMSADQRMEFLKSEEGSKLYLRATEITGASEGGFLQRGASERMADIALRSAVAGGEGGTGIKEAQAKLEYEKQRSKETASNLEKAAQATGELEGLKNLSNYLDDIKTSSKSFTGEMAIQMVTQKNYREAIQKGADSMAALNTQLEQAVNRMTQMGFVPAAKPK
jgi:hypothetical protein